MNQNKRPPKHVIAEIAKYIDELQIQIRDQANEADAEEAEVKVSEAALAIGSDLEGREDKMMDDVAAQLQLHDQTDILGEAQSDAIKLVAQIHKARTAPEYDRCAGAEHLCTRDGEGSRCGASQHSRARATDDREREQSQEIRSEAGRGE